MISKSRNLDASYGVLGVKHLPYAITAKGHRCLFLDVVSAGSGGPDFRLNADQLAWAELEIDDAAQTGINVIIFMHTYPADLREGADLLGALLARPNVMCLDMGHTHYNELANDGRTVFMATRSTGQIEEGVAGFSIAVNDGACVSWRFKPLEHAWPFVLITRPADRRLVTRSNAPSEGSFVVRAKVIGGAPTRTVLARRTTALGRRCTRCPAKRRCGRRNAMRMPRALSCAPTTTLAARTRIVSIRRSQHGTRRSAPRMGVMTGRPARLAASIRGTVLHTA